MTKEILKEEILTEKQLDTVAGGNLHELQMDANFLHDLGRISPMTFPQDLTPHYGSEEDIKNIEAVQRAWAKFGISVVNNKNGFNEYYNSKGEDIGRQKAIQTVIKKAHSKLNYYEYL